MVPIVCWPVSLPFVGLSTVGNRAFTVDGPRVWNTLLENITSFQSLSTFSHHVKTWLFKKSHPDVII